MVCSCFSHVMFMCSCVDVNFNAMGIPLVMATDITDGYNPWIFWNPSSVVNFFGKMEKRRCRRHL